MAAIASYRDSSIKLFRRSARTFVRGPTPRRRPALLTSGSGRPGLVLAGIGGALALAFVVLGFVDLGRMLLAHAEPLFDVAQSWCLALVAAIAFAGVGAWWQLERARQFHPDEAVDGARSVLRILVLFFLVTSGRSSIRRPPPGCFRPAH
jgi:hypothetical protein